MTLSKLIIAAAASAISLGFATSANAGECPAGSVMANATPPGPSMPSMVKDDVISAIDLGAGYGIPGRALRMRRLEIKPGGVVPWHSHDQRPANIYVENGVVTEYRSNCAVPIVHRRGDVIPESGAISHWWRNNGSRTVVLLSSDVLPPQAPMTMDMSR